MKVTAQGSAAAAPVPTPAPEPPVTVADGEATTSGRAIVPVKPIETDKSLTLPARRGSAPFLAQLIAADRALPQTRERRRAAPREAIAAYGATAARVRNRSR